MKTRLSLVIPALIGLTGCASHDQPPQASPAPTAAQIAQSVADTQKQIQSVQNDPSIPPATKQTIISHLQNNLSRTQALQSGPAPAQPAPAGSNP
jgi:TolA-binding protein